MCTKAEENARKPSHNQVIFNKIASWCRYIDNSKRSNNMVKRIVLIAILLAMAVCFAGCQMVEGLGKDVQWTGESIQKTAD